VRFYPNYTNSGKECVIIFLLFLKRVYNVYFCKIIKGEIPSNRVLESDKFLAFHDINPVAPVHILIIPKEHIGSFHETPKELMGEMTPFIQEVGREAWG